MQPSHDITLILTEWDRDPGAALDRLTPLVYNELHRLAAAFLRNQRPGHTLQPTALVHEAYLRLSGAQDIEWKDRRHFFGVASRAMRLILVDSARRHFAPKHGAGNIVTFEEGFTYCEDRAGAFLRLNDAIEALERWDSRKHKVLEMKYFGGLTREEIAGAMDLSLGTVKRDLSIAEAFLRRELAAS